MEWYRYLIKSVVAGVLIGLGGATFLSVDNKILGAALFSVGLMSICATGQLLYTGQISYIHDVEKLFVILGGNIYGSGMAGVILHEIKPEFATKAQVMCELKLEEKWYEILILGIFCNVLIYFAVEGFRNGQTIALILCVMAFILCGFEHCIANMFYFTVSGMNILAKDAIIYFGLNIIGNTIGGIVVQTTRGVYAKRRRNYR